MSARTIRIGLGFVLALGIMAVSDHVAPGQTAISPGGGGASISPVFVPGEFCTLTHGGWAAKPHLNWLHLIFTLNSGVVTIGTNPIRTNTIGTSCSPLGCSTVFSLTSALAYLPGGGPPGPIPKEGVLGRNGLALLLNVEASKLGCTPPGFGDLRLRNTNTSLDGTTVAGVLDACNTALAGNGLPLGYTFSDLNDLSDHLNEAFDDCGTPSTFAQTSLAFPD